MSGVQSCAPRVPEQIQESMELRKRALDAVQDVLVLKGAGSGWRRRRAGCSECLGQSGVGTAKTAILQLILRRKRFSDVRTGAFVFRLHACWCITVNGDMSLRDRRERKKNSMVIRYRDKTFKIG